MKRTALRLPEAGGPQQDQYRIAGCQARPLRLLLLGESTVAGVGVASQQQALAGQLAAQLAQRLGRSVEWQAIGSNGARARDCLSALMPRVQEYSDLAVLVLGVNDTTHLTTRWRWRREIGQLLESLQARSQRLLLCGVPPVGEFAALPQPLRGWFGLRASLLDGDLRDLARRKNCLHVPVVAGLQPELLAADGYHPSALGYRQWAGLLADQLLADGSF